MKDKLLEKIKFPEPGKYVVAVSGGVDSMSLLHVLYRHGGYELVVVHCNHGIRPEAGKDERLVHDTAAEYGLEFQSVHLQLGSGVSEALARQQRYDFLQQVRDETGSGALVTAHHLDDRIETMILNRLRGAGWLGLSPLHETGLIKRPLLKVTKKEIIGYAKKHSLEWREDLSNLDPGYTMRNRIRAGIKDKDRQRLYTELRDYDKKRYQHEQEAKNIITDAVEAEGDCLMIDRVKLLLYDVATVRDGLFIILKDNFQNDMEVDYDAVVRLEHFYKTAAINKRLTLSAKVTAWAGKDTVRLGVKP